MLALGNAARRGHQQGKAEISRCLGQHIGGIRALHARGRHRRHIEIVVAHRHIGHDLELRAGGKQLGIDALRTRGKHAILALQLLCQLCRRPDHIVLIGLHFKMLLQPLHHLG